MSTIESGLKAYKPIRILLVYFEVQVLVVMLLGFSAGLPLALTLSTLSARLTELDVSLTAIGLYSLVGMPYSVKFLWAPLIDSLRIPILSTFLGRRRSWLILSQFLLIVSITALGYFDPVSTPVVTVFAALCVTTASATQDIVIDSYRIESLPDNRQAAGIASYVAAYRVALLVSGAGVLYGVAVMEQSGFRLSDAWMYAYWASAGLILVGCVAVLIGRRPEHEKATQKALEKEDNPTRRIITVSYEAFRDFLRRPFVVPVLLFVVLFKFCDTAAGIMTTPFLLKIGFTKEAIAAISKFAGFIAAVAGGFAGGFLARFVTSITALWIAGVLQMLSNMLFSWQAWVGVNEYALMVTIIVENFTGGLGTVIFVAYISGLCRNPIHTATQFALLTALASVGRTTLAASAGAVAEVSGWILFFFFTALAAIPGLLLLFWLQMKGHFNEQQND